MILSRPFYLFLFGLLCALPIHAATPAVAFPNELYGYLLLQSSDAFTTALGKPFKEGKSSSGDVYQAFHLPGAKDTYFVANFTNDPANTKPIATMLQISGTDPQWPTGFLGLRLGDAAGTVEAKLGKPGKIMHESDANLDLWDYPDKNYSVEMLPDDHKLYSIQVMAQNGSKPDKIGSAQDAYSFATAIRSGDVSAILEASSGELECADKDDSYGFRTRSARSELSDPKSALVKCLNIAAKAAAALGPAMKGTTTDIRISERGPMGSVVKFPQSSPLAEIVFHLEFGRWRVYEVTMR